MSTSSHGNPEKRYSNITEGDFAERPEQEGSQSSGIKILWIVLVIAVGILGVYLAVTLFSVGLESIFEGPNPDQAPTDQEAVPTQKAIPADND